MKRRSPGDGTVFQRNDGRWQASLQVNGIRQIDYGRTRREAYQKLASLRKQATDTGTLPHAGTMTVGDLLERWLATITPTLKPRTLADYRQTCELYILPILGTVRLSRLSPDSIQHLYSALQGRERKRAAAKAHAVLHRACKLAVLWGWLAVNPTERVIPPSYRPERREMWSPWELNAFMSGAQEHWLYPLWLLALTTGCRLGELLALEWGDVAPGRIRISKSLQRIGGEWITTAPKTRSSARTLALPPDGTRALQMQREQQAAWRAKSQGWPSDLVFTQWSGAPLHAATVSHGLRAACRRLGITPITVHDLRHMHASLLLAQGVPVPTVSARLGHAHAGVTMAVYAHMMGGQDQEAAAAIGRAIAAR